MTTFFSALQNEGEYFFYRYDSQEVILYAAKGDLSRCASQFL